MHYLNDENRVFHLRVRAPVRAPVRARAQCAAGASMLFHLFLGKFELVSTSIRCSPCLTRFVSPYSHVLFPADRLSYSFFLSFRFESYTLHLFLLDRYSL